MIKFFCDSCDIEMVHDSVHFVNVPMDLTTPNSEFADGFNTEPYELCQACYRSAWDAFTFNLDLGAPSISKVAWSKFVVGQDVIVGGYLAKVQASKTLDLLLQILRYTESGHWVDMVGLIIESESIKEYVQLENLL